MKVTYDPQADAVYIALKAITIERTSALDEGTVIDYDVEGEVVGVEILHASRRIDNPLTVEFTVIEEG
jgi:uncharacterized protein YuzE